MSKKSVSNVVSMGSERMACVLFERAATMLETANTHRYYDQFEAEHNAGMAVLEQAASLGDAHSQYMLGRSLYCRQKFDDAYGWLEQAIVNNCDYDMSALFLIASIYEYGGERIERNLNYAMELYQDIYNALGCDEVRDAILRVREKSPQAYAVHAPKERGDAVVLSVV
jgi:TPR repeat protein